MSRHQFLSDEWVAEARKIREEHDGAGVVPHKVRMNLVITEVPFAEAPIDAHMDTTTGEIRLDLGHLDEPDLKVTVDYATAKSILIEGSPQAGMQAFMAGKIKVEGDVSKLMALQAAPVDVRAQHIAQRLKDITA